MGDDAAKVMCKSFAAIPTGTDNYSIGCTFAVNGSSDIDRTGHFHGLVYGRGRAGGKRPAYLTA
jgi:hypothetical protein